MDTLAIPSAVTSADTTAPAPATSTTPSLHAGMFSVIFTEMERIIDLAADPAVLSLLPTKFQGYAAAALLVKQLVTEAAPTPSA